MSQTGRQSRRGRRAAFTLLEILLVVVIIGILAATVIPSLAGRATEARIAAAKQDVFGALGVALDVYEQDCGVYPTTEQGLGSLVEAPAGAQGWKGPYLKTPKVPLDPWGNAYEYRYPRAAYPTMYELASPGADGQLGTADDISNMPTE